jgi:hypothetical protein
MRHTLTFAAQEQFFQPALTTMPHDYSVKPTFIRNSHIHLTQELTFDYSSAKKIAEQKRSSTSH